MSNNLFYVERANDDLAQFYSAQAALVRESSSIFDVISRNDQDSEIFTPISELQRRIQNCTQYYTNMNEFFAAYINDRGLCISESSEAIVDDVEVAIDSAEKAFVFTALDIKSANISNIYCVFQNFTPKYTFKDVFAVFRLRKNSSEFIYPPVAVQDFSVIPGTQINVAEGKEEEFSEALSATPPFSEYDDVTVMLCQSCASGEDFTYHNITNIDNWVSVNGTRCASVSVSTEDNSIMDAVWAVGDTVEVINYYNQSFVTTIASKNTATHTITLASASPFYAREENTLNLYIQPDNSPAYTVDIPLLHSLKKSGTTYDEIGFFNGQFCVKRQVAEDLTVMTSPTYEYFSITWQTFFSSLSSEMDNCDIYSINTVKAAVDVSGETILILGNTESLDGTSVSSGDSRDGQLCSISRLDESSQKFIILSEEKKLGRYLAS